MRIDAITAQSLLGVPLGADSTTIRSAFRERIRESHPDTGNGRRADLGELRAAKETLLELAPDRAATRPVERRPARRDTVIDLRDDRTGGDTAGTRRATARPAPSLFGGYADPAARRHHPVYADPAGLGGVVDLLL